MEPDIKETEWGIQRSGLEGKICGRVRKYMKFAKLPESEPKKSKRGDGCRLSPGGSAGSVGAETRFYLKVN